MAAETGAASITEEETVYKFTTDGDFPIRVDGKHKVSIYTDGAATVTVSDYTESEGKGAVLAEGGPHVAVDASFQSNSNHEVVTTSGVTGTVTVVISNLFTPVS